MHGAQAPGDQAEHGRRYCLGGHGPEAHCFMHRAAASESGGQIVAQTYPGLVNAWYQASAPSSAQK